MAEIVGVKLMHKDAKLPSFAHQDDACADIYSIEKVSIPPLQRAIIRTGIAIQLPSGFEAQIRPRSGFAFNSGITILNTPGTIDAGYRGEVKVVLFNSSDQVFSISQGDRIAQIAVRPVPIIEFMEVKDLETSKRGDGGFGSTGTS